MRTKPRFICFSLILILTSAYGRILDKLSDVSDNDDINNENNNSPKLNACESDESGSNEVDSAERGPCDTGGEALLLTPYIKEGNFQEAREKAAVDPLLFLGFKSYSGYFTVNETYNSNMFFWYFPNERKPSNETPWIIWLQGGPGASSMTGLFDEIGPFKVNVNGALKKNPFTWLQNHSLVFIDNPVGTGFSFTNDDAGFATDLTTYGQHLYSTVKQLVQVFPELKVAPLYIAGESYGGKFVPSLAIEIHNNKNTPGGDINLQGLIVGNGYIDPQMVTKLTRTYYSFGLMDSEQLQLLKPLMDSFREDIAANRSIEAKQKWHTIVPLVIAISHQEHMYNFLRDGLNIGSFTQFLKKVEVRRALHVGNIKCEFLNVTVNEKLAPEFLSSAKPFYETLLEHYRVLLYCGHLDQMISCMATGEQIRSWRWNDMDEFLRETRKPIVYRKKISGNYKTGGRLTEAIIRGAGHMVALDAPAPLQYMISKWTNNESFGRNSTIFLNETIVQEYIANSTRLSFLYL